MKVYLLWDLVPFKPELLGVFASEKAARDWLWWKNILPLNEESDKIKIEEWDVTPEKTYCKNLTVTFLGE